MKIRILEAPQVNKLSDGVTDYYWYRATRLDNEANIRFGCFVPDLTPGREYDAPIEKKEFANGRPGYTAPHSSVFLQL